MSSRAKGYRKTTLCLAALISAVSPGLSQEKGDSLSMPQMLEPAVFIAEDKGLFSSRGKLEINMDLLSDFPKILGQNDPLRAARTMPGVLTNKESSTGLYIQGCDASHSIVTINGAQVFCPDHFLGLFSAFIGPHFDSASLITGINDASFTDRLGGGLDLKTFPRAGRTSVEGTLSLISSDITMKAPAGEDGCLQISGRKSYINGLYGKWMQMDGSAASYGFQDGNISYSHVLSSRDSIVVSAYAGHDDMGFGDINGVTDETLSWTNGAVSARWVHHGKSVRSSVLARWSGFSNSGSMQGVLYTGLKSSVRQAGLSYHGEMHRQSGTYSFGAECSLSGASPFSLRKETPDRHHGAEAAAYAGWSRRLTEWLAVSPGIRVTGYSGECRSVEICPRVNLEFTLPVPNMYMTLHYGRYVQNLHQLTLFSGGLPIEYWTLPDGRFGTETEHSYCASISWSTPSRMFSFRGEVYRRDLSNLCLMAINPFVLVEDSSHDFEDFIYGGNGRAVGADVSVQKNLGRLKGYLTYSLSRATRHFPDLCADVFPSPFDRMHNLNAVMDWHISESFRLSAVFSFSSGTPYTSMKRIYLLGGIAVPEYGGLYASRLPDNHRLDISAAYSFRTRHLRALDLGLSVYNAYAHRNVQFIRYSPTDFMQHKVVYIGFPLPSIDLHFKF